MVKPHLVESGYCKTIKSYLNEDVKTNKKGRPCLESLEYSNINKDNLVVKEIKSVLENNLNPLTTNVSHHIETSQFASQIN